MAQCKAMEGCDRDAKKVGFCNKHYAQFQRGVRSSEGELLRELRATYVGTGVLCIYPKCKRVPFAKKFCSKHYQLLRFNRIDEEGNPTDPSTWKLYTNPNRTTEGRRGICRLEDCDRPRNSTDLGLCAYHYRRFHLGIIDGDGNKLRAEYRVGKYGPEDLCKVVDCDKQARSNWMCRYHAQRLAAGAIDHDGNKLTNKSSGRPRKKNPRWKTTYGYIKVRAPEGHPHADKDGMIFEHRLVMEKVLGRILGPHDLVHHKDGVRDNNDPKNLELLTRKSHPIAKEYTRDVVEKGLEALKHNNPKAYRSLLKDLSAGK